MTFPHGAAVGVAGEPVGGRQTLQPSRRWHVVHGARRRFEDAVASLPGSGGLASGHARRQSQSSGDRGTDRPAGQYGDSPHQPRWRPQSSGGDASGSCDNPRSVRPPGSSFRRARRDSRARARPQARGAGASHDFVAECHIAAYSELRTHAQPSRRPIRACCCLW